MKRNDGTQLFSPWAHYFSAPKLYKKKMERRIGWMEITHPPLPLLPKTKFHIIYLFIFWVYCARCLATYFILFFFFFISWVNWIHK